MTDFRKIGAIGLLAILPFAVGLSALLPSFMHYWVSRNSVSEDFVLTWAADARDRAAVLDKLSQTRLGILGDIRGADSVRAADLVLEGTLITDLFDPITVELPFQKTDLLKGEPELQLQVGSLLLADILLEAYLYSGDAAYLAVASEAAREFLAFEKGRLLDYAFLWNDHAVAERTIFITRLIHEIVKSEHADPELVRELFESLDHSIQLLAKPDHFTYRTNHGIMQSIAVLHVAAFARELPAVATVLEEVTARLAMQMEYFVSRDGVVLEHSVGYQEFGIANLNYAIQYMRLVHGKAPDEWLEKQKRAGAFYRHLLRPDGSVPRYGDTTGLDKKWAGDLGSPENADWISQDMGYWSSWIDNGTHLFAAWANFIGRAHKHADELSLIFWHAGEEWWTGAGYWPYGDARRHWGVGWDSGNAPHESGEPVAAERQSRVTSLRLDEKVRFVNLRRERPDGYRVDRTIVALADGPWFVLDAPSGTQARPTISSWSTMNSVSVESPGQPDLYRLSSRRSTESLLVNTIGGPQTSFRWTRGMTDPLEGWISVRAKVQATNTMVVNIPADSWSLVAWARDDGATPQSFIDGVSWDGPESWSVNYRQADRREVTISREQDELSIHEPGSDVRVLELQPGATAMEYREVAERAFIETQATFGGHKNLLPWRMRILQLCMVLGIAQLAILMIFWRFRQRRFARAVVPAGTAFWMIAAAWIHFVYLVP